MALKKCKECGNEVSTKAESCPKCGAVLKKKTAWGYIAAVLILGAILLLRIDDTNKTTSSKSTSFASKSKPQAEAILYKEGQTVPVGYMTYEVKGTWWSNRLSYDKFLDQRPNAKYLFVDLTVRNHDKKARTVPPFKLVDENGAEYEASSNSWALKGSIGIIETLNPSVSKQGFVVFDVPKSHQYRMKLSGGYWSSEDAHVQLNPIIEWDY